MTTALYLAHLNPVTRAHVGIIRELQSLSDRVAVMPVVFLRGEREVNSRSFPFGFEAREGMLRAVFGDAIDVSRNYTFRSPFSGYMPPLLSRRSWELRRGILDGIDGDYFTYTGDRAEGWMLRLYRLRPRIGRRRAVSATSVREMIYDAAAGGDSPWKEDVPPEVAGVIEENWDVVERFAGSEDLTRRIAGMKFPTEGYSEA